MSTDETTDATGLERRLEFMGLDAKARDGLAYVRPILDENLSGSLTTFYGRLAEFPETRKLFGGPDHVRAAASRQAARWGAIVAARHDPAYAQAAREIGETQAQTGLEARWCIGGYALILEQLVGKVLAKNWPKGLKLGGGDRDRTTAAVVGLVKTALLDLDLVLSAQMQAAERARREADAARAKAEGDQHAAVATIAKALRHLAQGDLRLRLNEALPGDYEALRHDFNEAVAHLEEAMTVVNGNASAIRSGVDEIAQAADDLSRRTEQQAASLEETAAALDQITATVSRAMEGALQADAAAQSAKSEAEANGEIVRQASEAMSEIEKSAKEIGQIIGVIDEIAFQTNLLALNAGVEAARAGEAGRGFAVVASEVRALAQRSADAAKEIKALISASSRQVEGGAALVVRTGQALEQMGGKVGEISSLISEIAASAREQATGLAQVNTAVNEMDQVTQQNAAMVEESTAASHALANETEALVQSIARFRLGQATAPAARPSAPALKTMGGRGVSALAKAEPAAAEWEEF